MFCLPPGWDDLHPGRRRKHLHWQDSPSHHQTTFYCCTFSIFESSITQLCIKLSRLCTNDTVISNLLLHTILWFLSQWFSYSQVSTLSRACPRQTLPTRPTSPSSSSPSSSSPSSPSSPVLAAAAPPTSPAACWEGHSIKLKQRFLPHFNLS